MELTTSRIEASQPWRSSLEFFCQLFLHRAQPNTRLPERGVPSNVFSKRSWPLHKTAESVGWLRQISLKEFSSVNYPSAKTAHIPDYLVQRLFRLFTTRLRTVMFSGIPFVENTTFNILATDMVLRWRLSGILGFFIAPPPFLLHNSSRTAWQVNHYSVSWESC